jgi:ELWxxDGT repeat protein
MYRAALTLICALALLASCAEEPPGQRVVAEQGLAGDSDPAEMLIDIGPNRGYKYYPDFLTPVGDQLFFVGSHADVGMELFVTDGTTPNTNLVSDINPGTAWGIPSSPSDRAFAAVGENPYFTADDGETGIELWFTTGTGRELWVTDGTEAGTELVRDIYPGGSYDSWPADLTVHDGQLYFSATAAMRTRTSGRPTARRAAQRWWPPPRLS